MPEGTLNCLSVDHLLLLPSRIIINGPTCPPSGPPLPPPPRFNLKDHNLIGAGQYNGQFSLYDMRKGGSGPAETTPVDISHRDPVYDMAWLQSKTGTEAMTTSTDGQVWISVGMCGRGLAAVQGLDDLPRFPCWR